MSLDTSMCTRHLTLTLQPKLTRMWSSSLDCQRSGLTRGILTDGRGVALSQAVDEIVRIAKEHGVEAIHPGYGFLSERSDFARKCEQEGIAFVGPRAETLEQMGDKTAARNIAIECEIPVIPGEHRPPSPDPSFRPLFYPPLVQHVVHMERNCQQATENSIDVPTDRVVDFMSWLVTPLFVVAPPPSSSRLQVSCDCLSTIVG